MKSKLLPGIVLLMMVATCIPAHTYAQACCIGGNCIVILTRGECHQKGGIYFGANVGCADTRVNCAAPDPPGACCIRMNDGTPDCRFLTQRECMNVLGARPPIWVGDGVLCVEYNCSSLPMRIMMSEVVQGPLVITARYDEAARNIEILWQNSVNTPGDFYIGRSINDNEYKIIGYQLAGATGYRYVDNYPLLQANYRIFYWDRGQMYSSRISTTFAVKSGTLNLQPNPSFGTLRILLAGMESHDVDISIYDLSGRMVLGKHILRNSKPELDVSGISAGTYMVQAKLNGQVYVGKLIKK